MIKLFNHDKVIELRNAGYTFKEIIEQLDLVFPYASKALAVDVSREGADNTGAKSFSPPIWSDEDPPALLNFVWSHCASGAFAIHMRVIAGGVMSLRPATSMNP
ncbi:hypothetical protein ACFVVC_03805 [Pseudarthrobacter sp. NPDC058196]|uniref:hypothetical protein n=1 Tax=Pseudarthrobacter sp. NPDC058196 TaxID=3346376 RepID=UPI0036D7A307